MNYAKYYLSLDVNSSRLIQDTITMVKGDTRCRIIAYLTDGGKPYHLTDDCFAVFKVKKPLGYYSVGGDEAPEWEANKYYSKSGDVYTLTTEEPESWSTDYASYYTYKRPILFNNCAIDGDSIIYDVTSATTNMNGFVDCEITVYGHNGKQITSPRFAIIVENSLYDDSEVIESSEFTALAAAIGAANLSAEELIDLIKDDVNDATGQLVSDIEANTLARHTHSNKSALDRITYEDTTNFHTHSNKSELDLLSAQAIGIVNFLQYNNTFVGVFPLSEYPFDQYSARTFSGFLNPYFDYRIGSAQYPAASITVTSLYQAALYQTNEYYLDFYSGATPTILTLPANVEWADELTIEANKHYQISIVNNIALWCAVDVEVAST